MEQCYFAQYFYVQRIKHKELENDFVAIYFCCCLKELEIIVLTLSAL